MPFNPDTLSSLEQQELLKSKTGLEGLYAPEFQKTLKSHPKPFVLILQNDPTAYKTIADIIGEDRAREIQAKQPSQNDKNPDNYSENPITQQIQKAIYENLGINVSTDSNGFLKKLIKGCIDGLIIGNVELIEQIKKRGLGAFLGEVVSQFKTTEGWKKLFSKIGDDVGNIFSMDAYKTGKTGSEYIGMIGGAGLAGWALKKGGKAVAETGAKAAIKAEGKTIVSSTLESTGNGMIKTGEALQVPYKAVEKATSATLNVAGKGLRAGGETLASIPGVQKLATAVKSNVARIVVGEGARVVASREIPTSLRSQIGAVGDVGKVKPFDKGEGKAVLEEGKAPDPKIEKVETGAGKSLYEDPKYAFLNEPEYQALRDILPNLSQSDIIGEGLNGIILKHPNESQVFKIAKPKGDNLKQEFKNQKGFMEGLTALKESVKGTPDADLLKKFGIPEISKVDWAEGIYEMEKVNGINFKTYATILHHQEALKDLPKGWYHGMTDNQIDEILRQKGLKTYSRNTIEDNEMWKNTEDRSFLIDLESEGTKLLRNEGVEKVINLLKQNGYNHGDYHWGNAMITPDGNIYIIDFGRSKLPPKAQSNQ